MEHKFDKSFIDGILKYKPSITEGLGNMIGKVSDTINKVEDKAKRFNQLAKQGGDTALIHLFRKDSSMLDELQACKDRGDEWFEHKGKKYPCNQRTEDLAKSTQPTPTATPTPPVAPQQTAAAAPIAAPRVPPAARPIRTPPGTQPIKYPQP